MKLNKEILQKNNACKEGYEWYLKKGCNTVEETVEKLMTEDKFNWANWLIANTLTRKNKVKYAVYAAELVLDIYEEKHPKDNRPRKAIEAAKAWIKNPCEETKNTAHTAARAARVAYNYYDADYSVASAAADAAYSAAHAAAHAAYITTSATADVAYAAAYTAARLLPKEKIETKIIKYGMDLLPTEGE